MPGFVVSIWFHLVEGRLGAPHVRRDRSECLNRPIAFSRPRSKRIGATQVTNMLGARIFSRNLAAQGRGIHEIAARLNSRR